MILLKCKSQRDEQTFKTRQTDAYLDWEVVGSEAEMVSAAQWRELRAHMHLQMLEEVMVLDKKTNRDITKRLEKTNCISK